MVIIPIISTSSNKSSKSFWSSDENLLMCTTQNEMDLIFNVFFPYILIPINVNKCQIFYKYYILDHYNFIIHQYHPLICVLTSLIKILSFVTCFIQLHMSHATKKCCMQLFSVAKDNFSSSHGQIGLGKATYKRVMLWEDVGTP